MAEASPPPNLPLSSSGDGDSGLGVPKKPAGVAPGGQDIPDPFATEGVSTNQPSAGAPADVVNSGLPSAPPVSSSGVTPSSQPPSSSMDGGLPIAPPAFQQPTPRKRGRRFIILIVGGLIVILLLGAIGVVVARLLSADSAIAVPVVSPTVSGGPLLTTSPVAGGSPVATPTANAALDDPDDDGLTNAEEEFYGTDKDNPDSDGDGFSDSEEVRAGFDPLGDGKLDTDNDGFPDPDEREFGSDPFNPDTDGDGFSDGEEIENGFNPLIPSPGDKL